MAPLPRTMAKSEFENLCRYRNHKSSSAASSPISGEEDGCCPARRLALPHLNVDLLTVDENGGFLSYFVLLRGGCRTSVRYHQNIFYLLQTFVEAFIPLPPGIIYFLWLITCIALTDHLLNRYSLVMGLTSCSNQHKHGHTLICRHT